ncbi:MAG: TetR family transcriptional regulator, partial [Phycisphaerae bacterium]|nr:TetR family transcriptional regulator [Phycisphaerae bacterium]
MPRPKSFDPEAVLTKAMVVFWEKGFDAASISDL